MFLRSLSEVNSFLSSKLGKFGVPSLYLPHFPTIYLLYNLPLPAGRADTAWEPSKSVFAPTRVKRGVSYFSERPHSILSLSGLNGLTH
jgi:hypothetical protein